MPQHSVLTPSEQEVYLDAQRRKLALMSPLEYGVHCSDMVRFPHVEYIDKILLAAMQGRMYKTGVGPRAVWYQDPATDDPENGYWGHPTTKARAIFNISINEPPRHGKSFHLSEHLPAWFLTNFPEYHVHLASYEHNFAASWGAKARDLIEAHPELGVEVRPDGRANAYWLIKGHRGSMKTAGAGGPITGTGRHLGIIDDLLKNAEEAMSSTVTTGNINWYVSTWKTRKEPHPANLRRLGFNPDAPDIFCVDINISTRWSMNDLSGWLRENEDESWYFVNMPAVAFEDEQSLDYGDPGQCVIGRKPNEALCPPRYSHTALMELRTSGEGLFWFNALYQGVPRVEEGGLITRPFRYYQMRLSQRGEELYYLDTGEEVPAFKCIRFATVDLAATMKERSDYTVFAVWDVTPGPERKLLLRARFRIKMESADHEAYVTRWNAEFNPRYVGVENKTFGQTLIQNLRRRGNVKVRPLDPDSDKIARALPFGYLVLEGKVFFPKDAPWLSEFEDELLDFPNGRHDDQVDCAAYAALEYEKIPKTVKTVQEQPTNLAEKVQEFAESKARRTGKRRVKRVRYTR